MGAVHRAAGGAALSDVERSRARSGVRLRFESARIIAFADHNSEGDRRECPSCFAVCIAESVWYLGTMVKKRATKIQRKRRDATSRETSRVQIERIQTGVRMEKRLVKVLKGLAEYKDLSLGDLLEGICLHAFEGKSPFSPETLQRIGDLKKVYDLDLGASHSHLLEE